MTGRLKIGIICYPTFGGSGVVATELGLELAGQGHEVHFISSRMPARLRGSTLADVSFHEVNTYSYALFQHAPYTLSLAAKLADVVETFDLDLLHVHYAIPHAISAHLAREMLGGKIKLVTTLHGTDITLVGNDPSLKRITKYAIEQSDAVTAVSKWLVDETDREFEPSLPISVIPNFIDTKIFHPDLKHDWAGQQYCSDCVQNLIHVSNFRPVKRAPDVIDIFGRVLKEVPARLLMVGDGPDLPVAVSRARELGIEEHVRFMGNREDVGYLLAASQVMILPSASESFGLSALEAMACGCAVVASRIGGIPELVRHGQDGFLCELGDTASMAYSVTQLLCNPDDLQYMMGNARRRAETEFSPAGIVPRYVDVYAAVLGSREETTGG